MKDVYEKTILILNDFERSRKPLRTIFYSITSNISSIENRRAIFHYVVEVVRRINTIDFILLKLTRGNFKNMNTTLKNTLRLLTFLLKWETYSDSSSKHRTLSSFTEYIKDKSQYDLIKPYEEKIKNFNLERALKKHSTTKKLSYQYYYPEWIVSELLKVMPYSEVEALLSYTSKKRITWIRVNTLKTTVEGALKSLKNEGIEVKVDTDYPIALMVKRSKVPISLSKTFKSGMVTIQDKASMVTVFALNPLPGETIWDSCAAPAMKTTLISQLMNNTGIVIATDYSLKRSIKAIENINLLGVSNVSWFIANAETFSIKLDIEKVLIDAPCSSTGVFQSDPDFKWRVTPRKLRSFITLQRRLLKGILNNIKNDVIVVYSTCSILPQEGEEQIIWLKNEFGKKIELAPPDIIGEHGYSKYEISEYVKRTFPHIHKTKGFFISKFIYHP